MKLHLGCGKKNLPGYIHIDIKKYDHIDYVCDISDMKCIMVDDSVDEIYSCHVFEHFQRKKIFAVLAEWNRVLKIGGVLRISIPDFEAVVELYNKDKNNWSSIIGLLYGGQRDLYDFHYMGYDFHNIKRILEICGFGEIERYDHNTFLPDDYDDYSKAYIPHMDEKNGKLMSLNIICKKISNPKLNDEFMKQIIGKHNV